MLRVATLVLAWSIIACHDEPFDLRPRAKDVDASVPDATIPDVTPQDSVNCETRSGDVPRLKLTSVAGGLNSPVYVTSLPGNARELYVVGRFGRIDVIRDGELLETPFLDLSDRVLTEYVERGLLNVAFHPDYRQNGRFFVYYVTGNVDGFTEGDVIMAEFRRSADPERAELDPEQIVFRLPQLGKAHKAGMMTFDRQGLLFIAVGNASHEVASRETDTLLGKILRIDVDVPEKPYGIPPGNMEGHGVRPELWDYGFRNPWRFSLDACTDDLYVGDVGDGTHEEIDVEPAGQGHRNYGYPAFQGDVCYKAEKYHCEELEGDTKPLIVHTHEDGICAVIGGFVYRGSAIPGLRGTYLYADYCTGRFWAFEYDGTASNHREITEDLNPDRITNISSFGQDALGELYVTSVATGAVYRIDPE